MHKIYVKGYVGNFGTKVLIEKKYDELLKHFSKSYLDDLINNLNSSIKGGEIPSLNLLNISDRENIDKGGVLTTLWKLCDRNKWGLRFSLNKIPILQGTIEISNFFDINPYRLLTSNSEIIAIDENESEKVLNVINNEIYSSNSFYIPFIEIGETNKLKKRVRIDGETEAFLTKDFKDEIDKIIYRYTKDNIK